MNVEISIKKALREQQPVYKSMVFWSQILLQFFLFTIIIYLDKITQLFFQFAVFLYLYLRLICFLT